MALTAVLRSERAAAFLLLGAAVVGLVVANSPVGTAAMEVSHAEIGLPFFHLSVGHWIADGLLAVFFFIAAIELMHELTVGQLNSRAKAFRPAIAAAGGVIVPSLVYLAFTIGSGFEHGWPIPTATDIAFALGILAVFGRGIPSRLRIFMLALAILDDIVAIVIIAVFFTTDLQVFPLIGGAALVVVFALLSRRLGGAARIPRAIAMVVVGAAAWALVYLSGVHATIAGVALGLAMARVPAMRLRHHLEPWVNGVVLPLFALEAALVAIPRVAPSELTPAFWGIAVALPVGKLIGIAAGAWLGARLGPKGDRPAISGLGILAAGSLGGIGFTVSLLMNELAFAGDDLVKDEGTIAVLIGSGFSIVTAGILVSLLARRYRRAGNSGQRSVLQS